MSTLISRRGFINGSIVTALAMPTALAAVGGPAVGDHLGGDTMPFSWELPMVSSNSVPLKSSIDELGRPGFAVDIATAIARHAGFLPQSTLMPWERAMQLGRERKALVMAMFKTAERQANFDFSLPVLDDVVVVVTRRGHEFDLRSPDDLIGRRCAVQQGAQYGAQYAAIANRIEVETDNSAGIRLRKLLHRHFDCALFNPGAASVRQTIRAQGLDMADFSILPRPLARVPSYMAIGKGNDRVNAPLLDRLNHSIVTLRSNGTIDHIMQGYLNSFA